MHNAERSKASTAHKFKRITALTLAACIFFALALSAVFILAHEEHDYETHLHGSDASCATCSFFNNIANSFRRFIGIIAKNLSADFYVLFLSAVLSVILTFKLFRTPVVSKIRMDN